MTIPALAIAALATVVYLWVIWHLFDGTFDILWALPLALAVLFGAFIVAGLVCGGCRL